MTVHVRVIDLEVLRQHVENTGLYQNELAARVGITPQRMSQLLNGIGPNIEAEIALRIARVLGVEASDLFRVDKPDVIKHFVGTKENAETASAEAELLQPYLPEDPPATEA